MLFLTGSLLTIAKKDLRVLLDVVQVSLELGDLLGPLRGGLLALAADVGEILLEQRPRRHQR